MRCRFAGGRNLNAGGSLPGEPTGTWDLLRSALEEGLQSIDRRLEECGPLQPNRFNLVETNERLAELQRRGFWS
jgi:hypothetical protein